MSVELSDYTDQVQDKVNPPGEVLFPDATEDEWQRRLAQAFWQARIEGITVLDDFTCDEDGLIEPQSGTDDIGRDLVQLVICWAAWTAITNKMGTVRSLFSGKAGPVQVEIQQSATVLKARMDALKEEKSLVLKRLSDVGTVDVQVVDLIAQSDQNMFLGLTDWMSSEF